MSCSSFLYCCGFESNDIPITISQQKSFVFVQLDFSYKLIFGGDRKFTFVLPDDRLMFLRHSTDSQECNHATFEQHFLTVYSYPEMTFIKKVECTGVVVDIGKYIPNDIQFIPYQYFRNYSDFYIVDKWNRYILKLGVALSFSNLIILEEEAIKIITGPVSPYFLVQLKNKTIRDLSGKLPTSLNYPQCEIKCGSAGNTAVILVDKFDNIHIYESSDYIKKEMGIEAPNDHSHSNVKFDTITKSVMGPIEDVQCGFFHVIFRTLDGRVFGAGFDNLEQVSFGVTLNGKPNFMEQSNMLAMGMCTRIGCFSRGHYLVNSKNDIFFVAEMFNEFPVNSFTHKKYRFVTVLNFNDIAMQTRDLRNGSIYNSIVNAGWHCCVAFDYRLTEKPSRFRNRLYACYTDCKVSDISINFK